MNNDNEELKNMSENFVPRFEKETYEKAKISNKYPPPKGVVLAKRPYKGPELGIGDKERELTITRSSYPSGFSLVIYPYPLGFEYRS